MNRAKLLSLAVPFFLATATLPRTASAQMVVIDPAHIIESVKILEEAFKAWGQRQEQITAMWDQLTAIGAGGIRDLPVDVEGFLTMMLAQLEAEGLDWTGADLPQQTSMSVANVTATLESVLSLPPATADNVTVEKANFRRAELWDQAALRGIAQATAAQNSFVATTGRIKELADAAEKTWDLRSELQVANAIALEQLSATHQTNALLSAMLMQSATKAAAEVAGTGLAGQPTDDGFYDLGQRSNELLNANSVEFGQ